MFRFYSYVVFKINIFHSIAIIKILEATKTYLPHTHSPLDDKPTNHFCFGRLILSGLRTNIGGITKDKDDWERQKRRLFTSFEHSPSSVHFAQDRLRCQMKNRK